ncbi:MAG: PorT family protein [Cytophagaceae bacterium]|nr:PorT family protein [Cytophagaceae bacterium]
MHTLDFWNKQHLSGKKIVLILFLLLIQASFSFAQEKKTFGTTRGSQNLPNYDDKTFHYGFTIGFNSARFRAEQSSLFMATDSIISVIPRSSAGFSLGFIISYRLADYFDLRLLPTVSFYERKIEYQFAQRGIVEQVSDNTFIEFPLMLKYKSQRRKNLRMYMVGGVKPGIEAGSKKKDRKPSQLRTNNMDFAIEYGFGFDIYYPLFKFSPEIRISHGLVNMLNADPNEYSRSLNLLSTHTVSVYLHFE